MTVIESAVGVMLPCKRCGAQAALYQEGGLFLVACRSCYDEGDVVAGCDWHAPDAAKKWNAKQGGV